MYIMKIQLVTKQNNISHKAYFKNNLLYKKAINSERILSNYSRLIKLSAQFKALPNHELEIVESSSQFYEVINNENGRSMPLKISNCVPNIELILEKVLGINGKFLFEPDGTLSTLYKDLTTPGNKLENFDNWKHKD